jgi:hypothetical protein
MCEAAKPQSEHGSNIDPIGRRRKLWEIDAAYHCSVLGTCLHLGELRSMLVKSGLRVPPDAPDYGVHANAVRLAGKRGGFAKAVNRKLDQRHAVDIARYAKTVSVDELEQLWQQDMGSGNVVGPYWAIITHSLTSGGFANQVFGDMHMLSHLVGASTRVDMKQFKRLEGSVLKLKKELEDQRKRSSTTSQDQERRIKKLNTKLCAKTEEIVRLHGIEARFRELEGGTEITHLRDRVKNLEGEHHTLTSSNERLFSRDREREFELETHRREVEGLKTQLNATMNECRILEENLISMVYNSTSEECDGDCTVCPCSLRGAVVLCVGGRGALVKHYKALTEQYGGDFLHHDGGKEHSVKRLPALLSQADVVVCPLDAVSHGACRIAKTTCKRMVKPFTLMRQSGVSSFLRALNECSSDNQSPGTEQLTN